MSELPEEVFTASDSLGWVYQFWQTKKKDDVNKSEVKNWSTGTTRRPHNFSQNHIWSISCLIILWALGGAARNLSESDMKNTNNEEELRIKASIPGVPLDYLRFVQKEDGTWTPAAGTFDGWPESLSDLRTLDPCLWFWPLPGSDLFDARTYTYKA